MAADELPEDLAARWYEYWRLRSGSRAERDAIAHGRPAHVQQAHDYVAARVAERGQPAVDLLVHLAEAGPAGDDGMTVGSGPLEELLRGHDRKTLELVAVAARRSALFGRAVSHAVMPPDV